MTRQRPTIRNRPNPQRKQIKRRSMNDEGPKFFVGLDLGQAQDYTALIIIERIELDPNERKSKPPPHRRSFEYRLRHLRRFPLGTPYPQIVDRVGALMEEDKLADKARLIVDGTGVGVPVVEMFRAANRSSVPCRI